MLARRYGIGHTVRCAPVHSFQRGAKTLMRNVSRVVVGIVLALVNTLTAQADFRAGADAAAKGNFAAAMSEWKTAAAAGDVDAQYNLGALLLSGKAGTTDIAGGVRWIDKAASQGHTEAAFALGMIFYAGLGEQLKPDFKRAYDAFLISAGKGHVESQYNVGVMLMNGQGTKQDLPAAAEWFRKAADRGHPQAQYNLGTLYLSGSGVKKDPEAAFKSFRKAAEQDYPAAQYNVARLYMEGQGTA